MNHKILNEVHKRDLKTVPEIRAGYTVKVHQKIKEGGKERIQIFEGLVIKVNSGTGLDKSFTVRKIASGIGVEKVFPVYSKNIAKIEVVKKAKVRRAKLYYMRERTGKSARLKETYLKDGDAKMVSVSDSSEAEQSAAEEQTEQVEQQPEVEATEAAPEAEEVKAEVKEEKAPEAEEKPEEAPKEEEKSEEVAEEPAKEEEASAEEAKEEEK